MSFAWVEVDTETRAFALDLGEFFAGVLGRLAVARGGALVAAGSRVEHAGLVYEAVGVHGSGA
ncbi:MAG: hypothetical protein ABJ285_19445 [Nitratireductor sp.]